MKVTKTHKTAPSAALTLEWVGNRFAGSTVAKVLQSRHQTLIHYSLRYLLEKKRNKWTEINSDSFFNFVAEYEEKQNVMPSSLDETELHELEQRKVLVCTGEAEKAIFSFTPEFQRYIQIRLQ